MHRTALGRPALACALTVLLASSHTLASPRAPAPPEDWQRCFAAAAQTHGVNVVLLRAIAKQESGMNPAARRRNTDSSEDHGLMQINSRWLPTLQRHGIDAQRLMQPCVNIYVGAWVLAQALRQEGDTWRGVGRYHSATEEHNRRYAWAVYRHLANAPAGPQ